MDTKNALTSWLQKGWCNKPTKLQFQSIFNTEKFDVLKTTNQPKSTVELGYMIVPSGTFWSTSSDTHQEVEI